MAPRGLLLLFLLFLFLPFFSSARRRISHSQRAFDHNNRLRWETIEETTTYNYGSPTPSTSSITPTTSSTTTSTTTETTTVEDDPIAQLLDATQDVANITRSAESEYGNSSIYWIDASYKAMDLHLNVSEYMECRAWRKAWNITNDVTTNSTDPMTSEDKEEKSEEDEEEDEKLEEYRVQVEIIDSAKRLKKLGISEGLLEEYKAVGVVFKEICREHGRQLWYRTPHDAKKLGISEESLICEPFKEELNPDTTTLMALARKINELIHNQTLGILPTPMPRPAIPGMEDESWLYKEKFESKDQNVDNDQTIDKNETTVTVVQTGFSEESQQHQTTNIHHTAKSSDQTTEYPDQSTSYNPTQAHNQGRHPTDQQQFESYEYDDQTTNKLESHHPTHDQRSDGQTTEFGRSTEYPPMGYHGGQATGDHRSTDQTLEDHRSTDQTRVVQAPPTKLQTNGLMDEIDEEIEALRHEYDESEDHHMEQFRTLEMTTSTTASPSHILIVKESADDLSSEVLQSSTVSAGTTTTTSSTTTTSVSSDASTTTTTEPSSSTTTSSTSIPESSSSSLPSSETTPTMTTTPTTITTSASSSSPTTTPLQPVEYEVDDDEIIYDESVKKISDDNKSTTRRQHVVMNYDDDIWDYEDMASRLRVEKGKRSRRNVIFRTKRSGSDDDDDEWLEEILTSNGFITEEEKKPENGENATVDDYFHWIDINATDEMNPTLLISSYEALQALGLKVQPEVFLRYQQIGLYLPGICADYVPKSIDAFNSSSFEGINIEGPIGVNISALEAAGVNLTALAEKLRNDTEVDDILSRTEGAVKTLGGSFILPVLEKNQYDPFSAPIVFQGSAVVVRFGIYIESMSNFQTTTMDYDMDIYLMMSWRDARLVNPYDKPILVKEEEILEKIWRPDPFFANAKEAEFHEVTFLNFLMRIYPDGLVLYETRVKITPSCNLILCKYPHDKQTCDLLIKSFAYPVETVRFEWFSRRKDAIDKNPDVKLPELYINRYEPTVCNKTRKSGEFSCLRAVFRLKRDVGFHIAQTYIPTSLALMFSWVGVWLPEEFMEGRIGVAITVLLTLSTESAGAREHLPSVSYLKAIDLWFGFITGFVFFTLLQTLFVIGFDKRSNQMRKWAMKKKLDVTEELRDAMLEKAKRYHKTGRYLDNFCRVFYPLSFVLFLMMYYFVFTEGQQDDCINRR